MCMLSYIRWSAEHQHQHLQNNGKSFIHRALAIFNICPDIHSWSFTSRCFNFSLQNEEEMSLSLINSIRSWCVVQCGPWAWVCWQGQPYTRDTCKGGWKERERAAYVKINLRIMTIVMEVNQSPVSFLHSILASAIYLFIYLFISNIYTG